MHFYKAPFPLPLTHPKNLMLSKPRSVGCIDNDRHRSNIELLLFGFLFSLFLQRPKDLLRFCREILDPYPGGTVYSINDSRRGSTCTRLACLLSSEWTKGVIGYHMDDDHISLIFQAQFWRTLINFFNKYMFEIR